MAELKFELSKEQLEEAVNNVMNQVRYDTGMSLKECYEKQIPEKVSGIHKSDCPEDIEYCGEEARWGYCPKCRCLQSDIWNISYCGECGQALHWSK